MHIDECTASTTWSLVGLTSGPRERSSWSFILGLTLLLLLWLPLAHFIFLVALSSRGYCPIFPEFNVSILSESTALDESAFLP
jgi:hypothetical protein